MSWSVSKALDKDNATLRVINDQFKANCESQNSLAAYREPLISYSQKAEIVRDQTSGLNYKDRRTLVKSKSTLEAEKKKGNLEGEISWKLVSERKEKTK